MRKLLILLILISGLVFGQAVIGQTDAEDRKARILENLQVKFPQLQQATVVINDIEPSKYGSLDQGSFTINGQQTQKFLISNDDTELYFVADPIDVSLSSDEIAAELARQEEEKAREAAERQAEIAKFVEGQPFRGAADAAVTIVEFSDFQCPYCARGAETMEQVLEKYPNDVKFVFAHFPLNFHPWAKPASIAAICASHQSQDAFWLLHDKYFEEQKQLNPNNVLTKSREYLAESGLDMDVWANCAETKDSEEYKAASKMVDDHMATGSKMGVSGTPGFFVNGQFLNGAQPLSAFEPIIEAAKKNAEG